MSKFVIDCNEDAGIVIDALILAIADSEKRKAKNPYSTSDGRVEDCQRIILSLGRQAMGLDSQEVMTSRLNSNQEKNNMAGSRSRQLAIKKTGATDQGGLA